MKHLHPTLIALAAAALYGLTACGDKDDHANEEHDHKDHDEHKEHPADDEDPKGTDEHDEHDHDGIIAGPNGGRVLTSVEPHAEFFVMDDRKVQIAFVDDDLKPVAAGEQAVSVVAGDRANPTRLLFQKDGEVLISDKALPDGNDFPIIVQLKTTPSAKSVIERFNLDLTECPTCKNKEYACTCDHHHAEEEEEEK